MNSFPPHVSHHDSEVRELKEDRDLAREYLKASLQSLGDPEERVAGLLGLAALMEARDDLATLSLEARVENDSFLRLFLRSGIPEFDSVEAYEHWFDQQSQLLRA
jgi:DNA-binding phage protein